MPPNKINGINSKEGSKRTKPTGKEEKQGRQGHHAFPLHCLSKFQLIGDKQQSMLLCAAWWQFQIQLARCHPDIQGRRGELQSLSISV
jgi:hypothetical protein